MFIIKTLQTGTNKEVAFKTFSIFNARYIGNICFTITVALLPLYMIRFSMFGFKSNVLDILLIISIIASLIAIKSDMQTNRRPIRKIWKSNPFQKTLLIGSLMLFVGLLFSFAAYTSLSGAGIIKSWFILPFFSVFLWIQYASKKEMFSVIYIILLSITVTATVSIWYWLQGSLTFDGRLATPYLSPNHLAMAMSPAIIIGWFFLRNSEKTLLVSIKNLFLLTAILSSAFVLYTTYSYGAWIGCSIGILVGELFLAIKKIQIHSRSQKKVPTIFLPILLFFFLVISLSIISIVNTEKFHSLVFKDERSSLSSRFMIWRSAWNIGKDHWFLGIGPGNFQEQYLAYQKFYPPYLEWAVPQPHNIFLAFWLQTGLIGVIGFLIVLYSIYLLSKEAVQKQTAYNKNTIFITIILSIITASLAHGIIDTTYWKNDLSVLWWLWIFLFAYSSEKDAVHEKNESI